MHDVAVIGGGPAGMSGALILGRVHRTVLLVDAGQGRNAPAQSVHNYLTQDGTPPERIRELGLAEIAAYSTVRVAAATVVRATGGAASGFRLELSDGSTEEAKRLLLATGLADTMPDIPGVDALWGRSAFHCPYCHGYECTGKTVAVLGAGPERVRLALQLSQFAKEVVLCTAGASLDPQLAGVFERAGIPVRQEPISRLEADGDQIERIVFDSGVPLAREALFIKTELRQSSDLPEQLGCFLLPDAYVLVDEFGHTSVPGVYAAGDMARRKTLPVPVSAVIAAAASGAFAAGVIDQDLLSEDFGLPNPFAMMPAEAEQP